MVEEASVMPASNQSEAEIGDTLNVRRGKLDSVTIYEVKESELELLERGSPGSIFLNFSIFSFSVGFSSLSTILTVEAMDAEVRSTFLIFAVIGLLSGAVLLSLWFKYRVSAKAICKKIKDRVPLQSD